MRYSYYLSACDTIFHAKGVIVDKSTQKPIANVQIEVKRMGIIHSDSRGRYKIDTFIYGYAGHLEALFSKSGYKTKHINFNSKSTNRDNTIIELERVSEIPYHNYFDRSTVSGMFYFNKFAVSLLNMLTLIFLLVKKKIRWKWMWILGLLFLNITVFLSITDASISDIWFINGPIYLTHYWMYPFSVKVVMPIAALLFWALYITKRVWVLKAKK